MRHLRKRSGKHIWDWDSGFNVFSHWDNEFIMCNKIS